MQILLTLGNISSPYCQICEQEFQESELPNMHQSPFKQAYISCNNNHVICGECLNNQEEKCLVEGCFENSIRGRKQRASNAWTYIYEIIQHEKNVQISIEDKDDEKQSDAEKDFKQKNPNQPLIIQKQKNLQKQIFEKKNSNKHSKQERSMNNLEQKNQRIVSDEQKLKNQRILLNEYEDLLAELQKQNDLLKNQRPEYEYATSLYKFDRSKGRQRIQFVWELKQKEPENQIGTAKWLERRKEKLKQIRKRIRHRSDQNDNFINALISSNDSNSEEQHKKKVQLKQLQTNYNQFKRDIEKRRLSLDRRTDILFFIFFLLINVMLIYFISNISQTVQNFEKTQNTGFLIAFTASIIQFSFLLIVAFWRFITDALKLSSSITNTIISEDNKVTFFTIKLILTILLLIFEPMFKIAFTRSRTNDRIEISALKLTSIILFIYLVFFLSSFIGIILFYVNRLHDIFFIVFCYTAVLFILFQVEQIFRIYEQTCSLERERSCSTAISQYFKENIMSSGQQIFVQNNVLPKKSNQNDLKDVIIYDSSVKYINSISYLNN